MENGNQDLIEIKVHNPSFFYLGKLCEIYFGEKDEHSSVSISRENINDSVLGFKRIRQDSPNISKFNPTLQNIGSPFIPFSQKSNKFTKPKIAKKITYECNSTKDTFDK
jgi:hypothetical protein